MGKSLLDILQQYDSIVQPGITSRNACISNSENEIQTVRDSTFSFRIKLEQVRNVIEISYYLDCCSLFGKF
jgi:hypothetical protein